MNASTAATRMPSRLPPLPARGARTDALSPAHGRLLTGAIVGVHVAAIWGLLQIREVREAVAESVPMFVSLISPETPRPVVVVPPPPEPRAVVRRPQQVVIAAAPSPAPAAFVVAEPPPLAEPPALTVPVVAAPAPPAPAAPAPPPRIIPASAVQYLEPIELEYPRLSKRQGESGRVLIRVYIDEGGLAKLVQVDRSSGHQRLDDAALAAVKKARFKPYSENGKPVAGWAFIPLEFELEK